MSLYKITENASRHLVTSFPHTEHYQKYKRESSPESQARTYNYIATTIDKQSKFSLATAFPNPWPEDIESIWDIIRDETCAAFVLAELVIDYLISDKNNWNCTKTNIQDRDFESNFYWK